MITKPINQRQRITDILWLMVGLLYLFPVTARATKDTLLDDFKSPNAKRVYQKILVDRVIRADLIELDNGEKIRLIGIKAPSSPKLKRIVNQKQEDGQHQTSYTVQQNVEIETDPTSRIEDLAFEFAKRIMERRQVRLEFDAELQDEQFHTLAYVFLVDSGQFVNAEILRQGYAILHIRPPNLKYADQLRSAYKEAKEEQRGLQGE